MEEKGVPIANINTHGIVPFVCHFWEDNPLFIVNGGIRGSMCIDVWGTAYTYETYPWEERKKPTKEKCREMALANGTGLWVRT